MATIDPERLIEIVSRDEMAGFCLACGAEAEGVEPDACRYTCGYCGQPFVYGAEEILMAGLLDRPAKTRQRASKRNEGPSL